MNTALLEKEQPAMVELFPPEETIPVNFDLGTNPKGGVEQWSLVCTTRCGPLGSYRTCGC